MKTVILSAVLCCVAIISSAPLTPNPSFAQLVESLNETFAATTAPEQFECIVNYLGEVSNANGLGELWSRSEPQLKYHIENWKLCPNSSKKFLIFLCNLKEFFQTSKIFLDYMKLLATQSPQALQQFIRGLPQKCGGSVNQIGFLLTAIDEDFSEFMDDSDKIKDITAKLRCAGKAVEAVFKGIKYHKIFADHVDDMKYVKEQLKTCKTKTDKREAVKCYAGQIKFAVESNVKFYKQLAKLFYEIKDDKETLGRVEEGVKKCFA